MKFIKEQIEKALTNISLPDQEKNIIESGAIKNIQIFGNDVELDVEINNPTLQYKKRVEVDCIKTIHDYLFEKAVVKVNLIVNTPELQHFVLETCYANASFYGECSLLCSFGGIAPALSRSLFESGRNGDSTTAFAIQARMSQMHEGFFRSLGGLEDRLKGTEGPHMDGAFDKLFANLAQPEFPIRILPPYQGLTETQADQARGYFHHHCKDIS